jgi:alkylation response protein AidB-like acyl-CoA dehydrogenase
MWLGTPEQKEKYLSRLLGGQCLFGFALPEPVFFNFLETPLSLSKGYSSEDGFLINGPGIHVVNGDVADVIMVHAKDDRSSASCFLVERGTQGLSGWITEGMTGAEARYTCKVKMENCHIPMANLLGQEGGAEEILGNFIAKDCCFTSARALGIAQGALEFALQYSQEREQFGRKISQFHAIQMILGDIGAQVEAARHLVYKAASALDQKSRQAEMLAAMAKYFASNAAMKVARDALQIFGGYGLMKDYPVEKMMRNAQLTQIAQGSLQNQRLAIAKELLK